MSIKISELLLLMINYHIYQCGNGNRIDVDVMRGEMAHSY